MRCSCHSFLGGSIIVVGDVAAVVRGEGAPGAGTNAVAHEMHAAIAEQHVDAAGMTAARGAEPDGGIQTISRRRIVGDAIVNRGIGRVVVVVRGTAYFAAGPREAAAVFVVPLRRTGASRIAQRRTEASVGVA